MTEYLPGGYDRASHIHVLDRVVEPPFRYRCVVCGTRLKIKSGITLEDLAKLRKMAGAAK